MTSLLPLNNFYPAISHRRVQKKTESDEIIVYDTVTRYGPRTSCQRKGLNGDFVSGNVCLEIESLKNSVSIGFGTAHCCPEKCNSKISRQVEG